ncbi:MAG: hypothetical protein K1X36_06315 [Pyrinomonadaceae bacterium]|nr:hypothetical protein [Pyrinomonadaceae bacterium]
MNELDHLWSQMLSSAESKALGAGRNDIAEYIKLKAANDAIRGEAVRWIFDVFAELADDAASVRPSIVIEREHPHRFERGTSRMVGSLVRARSGVRCLTLEAGWTRTPSDGIMRNGALAAARLTHFGIARANADLSLVYAGDLPIWHIEQDDGRRVPFRIADLNEHMKIFLGET